jgi:hypothetical protein
MSELHPQSDNLKLALSYQEWEMLGSVCRTITKGLRAKGQRETARVTDRLTLYIEDILAAQRGEGHV